MRKEIYLSLIERLSSIMAADGSAAIKHIDLWNENVSFIAEEVFAMPAVFVEFEPLQWTQLGQGEQMGTISIRLHIVCVSSQPTAKSNPMHSQALEFLDLIDQVNRSIFRLSGDSFGLMSRVMSTTNHNHEGVLDSVEVFRCQVYDRTATVETGTKLPDPLMIQITHPLKTE